MQTKIKTLNYVKSFIPVICVLLLFACGGPGTNDQQMILVAKEYLDQNKLRESAIELKNALQGNPENAEARYLLGTINLDMGDMAAAEKEFRRAAEAGWPEEQAKIGMARAMNNGKAFQKVLDEVKVEDSYPVEARADLYALRALAMAGLGDIERAKSTLAKASELSAKSFHVLKTGIQVQLAANDEQGISESLNEALAEYGNDREILLLSGFVALRNNDKEGAMTAYRKVVELDPDKLVTVYGRRARLRLARLEILDGSLDQAQATLEPLFRQNAKDPETNFVGGLLSFKQGEMDRAEERLLKVLKVAPDHTQTQLLYGTVSYAQKNYEQAAYYISRYIRAMPDNLGARKLLGRTYLKLGQHDEAQLALQPGLEDSGDDIELLALVGLSQLQGGNIASGIGGLEQAVELAPANIKLRSDLASAYMATGDVSRAISELEKVMQSDDSNYRARYMIVLAYLQAKDFDNASLIVQKMMAKWPDDAGAVNLMGTVLVAKGNRNKGREYFEKALQLDPGHVNAALNLARLDEADGKTDEATKRYLAVTRIAPKNTPAMMSLARIADQRGDIKVKINWLEKARSVNKSQLLARVSLSQYYLQQDDLANVETLVDEMASIGPEEPTVMATRAQLMMAQKKYIQAMPILEGLVEKHPKLFLGYYLSAVNQIKLGQIQEAKDSLNKAYSLNPEDFNNTALLAKTELGQGNYKKAIKLGEQLKKIAPDSVAGFVIEGDAQMASKNYKQAEEAYNGAWQREQSSMLAAKLFQAKRKAIVDDSAYTFILDWLSKHPDQAQLHSLIAISYESDGLVEKAIPHYEKVLEVQPNDVVVLNNLASIYGKRGDSRALDVAERAYKQSPESPYILDTYGWLLLQKGDTEQATRLLEAAAKKLPDIAEVAYHHAVALHRSGEKFAALKILNRLLASGEPFEGRDDAQQLVEGN